MIIILEDDNTSQSLSNKKCQTFAGLRLSNMRTCCISFQFCTVDTTRHFRKSSWALGTSWHFIDFIKPVAQISTWDMKHLLARKQYDLIKKNYIIFIGYFCFNYLELGSLLPVTASKTIHWFLASRSPVHEVQQHIKSVGTLPEGLSVYFKFSN